MTRGKKRQICLRLEESIVEEMEQIREKTGVPISNQIELRLKGFTITSTPEKGNPHEIVHMFANMKKNDELADNVDIAVEELRKGLKLQ
jgi:hypothetical protein